MVSIQLLYSDTVDQFIDHEGDTIQRYGTSQLVGSVKFLRKRLYVLHTKHPRATLVKLMTCGERGAEPENTTLIRPPSDSCTLRKISVSQILFFLIIFLKHSIELSHETAFHVSHFLYLIHLIKGNLLYCSFG